MIENFLVFKILLPTIIAFVVGIGITPFFSHIFYKYKLWKRSSRIDDTNVGTRGGMGNDFENIHNDQETKTPRVGGMIVWVSVVVTVFVSILLAHISSNFSGFQFISRNQTLIPFVSLLLGALLGLVDDMLQIFGNQKQLAIGIPRRIRIFFVLAVGFLEGLWFYDRLGYRGIDIPFTDHQLLLGYGFILFVMIVVLGLFSSGVIDGIDGLAGGVFAVIFASYGLIGVIQDQFNIATFCFVVTGALLSFLWFNIPPARFYLGETGVLGLTLSLAVIIFLTNTIFEFIIIGLPLIVTSASSLGQIIARRFFNTKILKIAPLHHHLEAIGWSRAKITMRYWILSVMCSVAGIIIVIIG